MFNVATAAKSALALEQDRVFRLIGWLTVLLGWLVALVSAGMVGLEHNLRHWQQTELQDIRVYLPADTKPAVMNEIQATVLDFPAVQKVRQFSYQEVLAQLDNDLTTDVILPLPQVLAVTVQDALVLNDLVTMIQQQAPAATVDDNRKLVRTVVGTVRTYQLLGGGLLAILGLLLMSVVSLVVIASLRNVQRNLKIMRVIGATDDFLSKLVVQRVLILSLQGWIAAVILAAASIFIGTYFGLELGVPPYWYWGLALVLTPGLLVLLAMSTAYLQTKRVLKT